MRVRIKIKRRRNRARAGRPGPRRGPTYWVAMGALAACATGGGSAHRAMALPVRSAAQANRTQGEGELPVYRLDIAAGPLNEALAAFERTTGWKIELAAPGIGGVQSRGAAGVYSAERALQLLLAGTGISYKLIGPESVRLELAAVSERIDVTAPAPELASIKYTEPLRDTPQTIMVIPRTAMDEQGATTLRDVLRNVPGLTVAAGEGGSPAGDNLTLRGFSARNDLFVDVRDISPQSRDPFNTEQVEVTKGPASAVSGRGRRAERSTW
ncbi:MAG: TonB-dependent receptor plug domain-containing protein [Bryobacteraceae bacterium]|nr:TonB-dependent receptor plug domain-containing protein [Bryobacteraceae bacterium]